MKNCPIPLDLIVTIVNKGQAERAMEAARSAGAEGGTIVSGRGVGIHEKAKILGIQIEPEKEIVLILIDKTRTSQALTAINTSTQLEKPGHGLAFVLDVEKALGICHVLPKEGDER